MVARSYSRAVIGQQYQNGWRNNAPPNLAKGDKTMSIYNSDRTRNFTDWPEAKNGNGFFFWKHAPSETSRLIIGWYKKGYSIEKMLTRKTCHYTRKEIGYVIKAHHAALANHYPF